MCIPYGGLTQQGCDSPSRPRHSRRSYETLLRARVGLHRSTARRGEVLRLEDQDAVAEIAGFADADEMMSEISAAAHHRLGI